MLDELISREIELDEVNEALEVMERRRDRPLGHRLRNLRRRVVASRPCGTGASATASSRSPRSASARGPSPATGGARSTTSRGCSTPRSTPASTSSTPRRSTATTASARRCSPTSSQRTATRSSSPPSAATTSTPTRKFPGQSERPHDWRAGVDPRAARGVAAPARHRLHRPLPAAQRAHRADPRRRRCGRCSSELRDRGQGPRARRRARPGDRLGRGRHSSRSDDRADRVAADGLQHARAGARPHVRGASPRSRDGDVGLIVARPARVRHALGQDHPRHRVPARGPPRAPQPRQHARQLRQGRDARVPLGGHRPHDRAGRDRGHPRQPGVHDRAAHRASTSTTCASTRRPSDLPLTADERAHARRALRAATSTTTTATRCR